MTEQNKNFNPLEPSNHAVGGGLWDDKIVTIISARTTIDVLKRGDGSAVLNDNGEQATRNVLEIVGLADGEEKERRETYSMGSLIPNADGTGFTKGDGTTGAAPHKNSELSHFLAAAKQGGYDLSKLWDAEKQTAQFQLLRGERFRMKGETRKDAEGNVKKNKKGYDEHRFYPVKYEGRNEKLATPGTAATGNNDPALADTAAQWVVEILSENGGKVGRAELTRKLTTKHGKDPNCAKVLALILKPSFHDNQPWTRDDSHISLS
ncbi:MAG TPA: hypothetical protein VIV60_00825 [Polyangiaceae bacterium]